MSEYQHKPLLKQVCQYLEGWQVDDSEECSWTCQLVHTSGAQVRVNGEGEKMSFFPLTAHFEDHYREFTAFPMVKISATKSPERIATDLKQRLLTEFLTAHEEAMTYMQAAYAEEVEAKAFMVQFRPLFPDCKIEGETRPTLYYHEPDLYEKTWGTPDSQWSGVSHLTAKLYASCKENWDIEISGYGKKALAELLKNIYVRGRKR